MAQPRSFAGSPAPSVTQWVRQPPSLPPTLSSDAPQKASLAFALKQGGGESRPGLGLQCLLDRVMVRGLLSPRPLQLQGEAVKLSAKAGSPEDGKTRVGQESLPPPFLSALFSRARVAGAGDRGPATAARTAVTRMQPQFCDSALSFFLADKTL